MSKVTDTAQSTLNATNITVNGLVQSGSTPSVSAVSSMYYDALGRQTNLTTSLGFTQSFTYDVYGQKATETDLAGNLTTYEYYPNTHTNVGQIKSVTSTPSVIK